MRGKNSLLFLSIVAFSLCSCGTNKPHEHNFVYKAQSTPTFYEDGHEAHYECSCGKYQNLNHEEIDPESIAIKLDLFNTLNSEDPITLFGQSVSVLFDFDEFSELTESVNSLVNKINKGNYYTAKEVNDLANKILGTRTQAQKDYDSASILADASGTPEAYNLINDIVDAFDDLTDLYYLLFVAVAKEGRYRTTFFKSYTDVQLAQYILDHDKTSGGGTGGGSTKESTSQKMEKLLNNYRSGNLTRYDAFEGYCELADTLASENNKNNYLDYTYSSYNREYTPANAQSLSNYVIQYITPMVSAVQNKIDELEEDTITKETAYKLANDFFGKNMDSLRKYAQFIGGSYKTNFAEMFTEGRFFLSSVNNPNVTAYSTQSSTYGNYIFMSARYQNLTTLVHEFGHYNSRIVFGPVTSLDLAEVQSQGNELLFTAYLENSSLFTEQVRQDFKYNELLDIINAVLLGCAVNELEDYAYKTDFTQQSLEAKWLELVDKYGAVITRDKLDYMYQVLLNYHGYYISYAVSAIAALEIYAKAASNLSSGKTIYNSICKKDSSNEKFKKSLQNAGLFDVFSENAYTLISQIN